MYRWMFMVGFLCAAALNSTSAAELSAALQSKLDAKVKEIQEWAAAPVVVNAVVNRNKEASPETVSMTQDQWKVITLLDPLLKRFTKNEAADFLKSKRGDVVTEAFLSAADGTKVAFLSKTTSWSHRGKPKHDQPMEGKVWQGPVEVDESSGARQIQLAVPVINDGKPVGSLVVGISIGKLEGN